MPAANIRAAIAAFLSAPPITGMTKVYKGEPFFVDAAEWNLAATGGWGAVGFVWIDDESESRVTLPALTGSKAVEYQAMLAVMYRWQRQSNDVTLGDYDAWIAPLDTIIDAVKTRLRSDPTLGSPGVIFEAAQGHNDLRVRWDPPMLSAGAGIVNCLAAVDFKVTEIVTA